MTPSPLIIRTPAAARPRSLMVLASLLLLPTAPSCGDRCSDDSAQPACDGQGGTGGSTDTGSTSTAATTDPTSTTTRGSGTADGGSGDASTAESGSETGEPTMEDFDAGALIIPMDIDHQDMGMLRAYGLVHRLLREGIPVRWVIRAGKTYGDVDFEATSMDVASGADVGSHGYRGGPFVVPAADAEAALAIVLEWQADYPETTVHQATEAFVGDLGRRLYNAPTIAVFADGNEDIARDYLMAAAIPDSTGDLTWPNDSPDMFTPEEVAGSDLDDDDGALFNGENVPRYCQFMSMHWGVADAEANPGVIAEVRAYLTHNTHFFAECQAVSAFENLGHFLTPTGFLFAEQPTEYDFFRGDSPFGQLDGMFESVGGSEPAYSLPPGDSYFFDDTVIITAAGTPEGESDVWMTGFLDGACPPDEHECPGSGKVSYLGGHAYDVALPISANPTTQGARLFLNSLFEAPCALE
jgi:hypothetical protein